MPQEPPNNVPRIVKVLNPSSGHYIVTVRMPQLLAAKYPSKPFLTRLTDIGLSKKDSDPHPDFVFIESMEMKGSPDLLWSFQKLNGPIWTTESIGIESLIPAKYRRQVTTLKTEQEVFPDTRPDNLTGTLTSSVVEQVKDTGKAVKINTSEDIDEDEYPLIGELTDTWGVNTTSESVVFEGSATDYGFGVKKGTVTPFGNGLSLKETENYPSPVLSPGLVYTLEAQEQDELTGVVIDINKSLVDASRAKALATADRLLNFWTEIQPIDKWHSIMISAKPVLPFPEQIWTETGSINLPDRLSEAGVIWDATSDKNAGASGIDNHAVVMSKGYSWNVSAEASVVGNVSGRPYTLVSSGYRGNASVTVVRTFHFGPPDEDIEIERIIPTYGVITVHGGSLNASAQSAANGVAGTKIGTGVNVRYSRDDKMLIYQFGPVLHSGIALTEQGDPKVLSDVAAASGGSLPGGGMYPTATANLSITGRATLSMESSTSPLISGDTYVIHVEIKPWRFGWWIKEVYTATVP